MTYFPHSTFLYHRIVSLVNSKHLSHQKCLRFLNTYIFVLFLNFLNFIMSIHRKWLVVFFLLQSLASRHTMSYLRAFLVDSFLLRILHLFLHFSTRFIHAFSKQPGELDTRRSILRTFF